MTEQGPTPGGQEGEFGGWSGPQPQVGPPLPPPRRRRRWPRFVAVLGVVGVVAAVAAVIVRARLDDSQYPDEWDEQVTPVAEWVADERDLEFEHPVHVEFLSSDAYREQVAAADDLVEENDDEAEDFVAVLRALGLVSGEVDLEQAVDDLAGEGTLAVYSPEDERIYVRGTELTPDVRVTLAHELTHVLQDQHFDLSRLADPDYDRSEGLRSVAEGDADAIGDAYAEQELTDSEREEYEDQSQQDADESEASLEDIPPTLVAFFAAPYVLGSGFLAYIDAVGGDDVDTLLEDPPSEQELFDPAVRGTPNAEESEVTIEAPDGADELDDGTFGSLVWFLLLAARADPVAAMRVADGWGGDHFVVYRQDDQVCANLAVVGDDELSTAVFASALTGWVAESPAGTARVEQVGDQVRLHACDPGADAEPVGELTDEVMAVPVIRTVLSATFQEGGMTAEQARCVVDRVLPDLPLDRLDDPDAIDPAEARQLVADAAVACNDAPPPLLAAGPDEPNLHGAPLRPGSRQPPAARRACR